MILNLPVRNQRSTGHDVVLTALCSVIFRFVMPDVVGIKRCLEHVGLVNIPGNITS